MRQRAVLQILNAIAVAQKSEVNLVVEPLRSKRILRPSGDLQTHVLGSQRLVAQTKTIMHDLASCTVTLPSNDLLEVIER